MKTFVFLSAMTLLLSSIALTSQNLVAEEPISPYVNDKGEITFPENFKLDMVHLGSWFVPAGDASGFHDVYTERESVVAYRQTGKFPDGATLVKELRGAEVANYSTGSDVSFASSHNLKQWFVMIKDTNNRFPESALWGKGWGWALFTPGDKKQNVASNYESDCLGCHVPAADKDWVYTEAYPVLKTP